MASIRTEVVIDSSPEQVWAAIRDVGAVHRRLLPDRVADTRIEGERTSGKRDPGHEADAGEEGPRT